MFDRLLDVGGIAHQTATFVTTVTWPQVLCGCANGDVERVKRRRLMRSLMQILTLTLTLTLTLSPVCSRDVQTRTRLQAFRSVRGRLTPENSRTQTDADH